MPIPSKSVRPRVYRVRGVLQGDQARFVPYPNTQGRWIGWQKVDTETDAEWRIDGAAGLDRSGSDGAVHTSDLFPKAPPIFLRRVVESVSVTPAFDHYLRRAISDGDLEEVADDSQ